MAAKKEPILPAEEAQSLIDSGGFVQFKLNNDTPIWINPYGVVVQLPAYSAFKSRITIGGLSYDLTDVTPEEVIQKLGGN